MNRLKTSMDVRRTCQYREHFQFEIQTFKHQKKDGKWSFFHYITINKQDENESVAKIWNRFIQFHYLKKIVFCFSFFLLLCYVMR